LRINNSLSGQKTGSASFKKNRDFSESLESLSTGLRISRSFGGTAGLVIAESLRIMFRRTTWVLQNTKPALRITESEATLENAINSLALSNSNQQAILPQSIVELPNAG
jgi:flagellin-like hook-associated protein FlgL